MTILDKIIAQKRVEVEESKSKIPIEKLMDSEYFNRTGLSMSKSVLSGSGIIAEFKRKSPSKGEIHPGAVVEKITSGYTQNGASGISVLTDEHFFGGNAEDLLKARKSNPDTPLLRKDFMVDEYQLYEAKAWGADVILLIAASLNSHEILHLSQRAHALDLEVLLEVHNREELEKSPMDFIDIVGVNNRNLKNFSENNVDASLNLYDLLPKDKVKISESCISHPDTVKQLKKAGYQGFLMGENFMKTNDPAETLKGFIAEIR